MNIKNYIAITVADSAIRLLGVTDDKDEKRIARVSLQAALGGVDFSKSLYASNPTANVQAVIPKGASFGIVQDGRVCVFITAAAALSVVNNARYLKDNLPLKAAIAAAIIGFMTDSAARQPVVVAEPVSETEVKGSLVSKVEAKIAEAVTPPISPADASAAVLKAVTEAEGEIILDWGDGVEFVTPPGSEITGMCRIIFLDTSLTIATLKTKEEIVKAYTRFDQLCDAMALDSAESLMAVSTILNTGLARDWGMDLVNVNAVRQASGSPLISRQTWINLDSIFSWLATYELYMKRTFPQYSCSVAIRNNIAIWQVGFKEAAVKFIQPLMHSVIPKAQDNTAGKKPVCAPFDKQKFLNDIKATKVPSVEAVVPEVLDPKTITMERVIEVANDNYIANQEEKIPGVNCESGPIISVEEAAGVSEASREQLSKVVKQPAAYADDDDLFADDKPQLPAMFDAGRNEWVSIAFDGFAIATVEHNGAKWASIARVCKDLGIDKSGQIKKLKGDPTYWCGYITTPDLRDTKQTHFCLTTKDLFRWLDSIGVNKLDFAAASRLALYKAVLMKVLVDHEVQIQVQQQQAQKQTAVAPISPEIQALLEAVRQTNETAKQMMIANQRLSIESQETLEFAADKTENLVNLASAEVLKAREVAANLATLSKVKDEEARFARQEEVRANKAKDTAEGTLAQVLADYEPAIEKGKAFDELIYNGPAKNITTIAKESGLGSGAELNSLLEELGMIIKCRRYANTWEPSAKMARMVPVGTKLGCIETIAKGNEHTIPKFGHTNVVHGWVWMPAGELLIKRIVREYLENMSNDALEDSAPGLKADAEAVPCAPKCAGSTVSAAYKPFGIDLLDEQQVIKNLQSSPPTEPFPGKTCDGRNAQGELNFSVSTGGKMP